MVQNEEVALIVCWLDQIERFSCYLVRADEGWENAPETLGYLGRLSISLARKGQYVLVVGDSPKQFSG